MSPFNTLSQVWPPSPKFTEANIQDLTGKVCIVTGSNTGLGKQVARILYSKNAVVYIAARNEENAKNAIASIKKDHPSSHGRLEYVHLDLADLSTIGASAQAFLAKETKLHLLFNNAGVGSPPPEWKTKQGYDLQLGVHCLGHFLFTKLLTPALVETAKTAEPGAVRVVWVSSSAADILAPKGGVELDNMDFKQERGSPFKYGVSKAGNYYHGTEYARRHRADGVLSVPLNPGNLHTDISRHSPGIIRMMARFLGAPAVYGAYTELFAALSPEITTENSGTWVVPYGRFLPIRQDLELGSRPESEGGTGMAEKFWAWSEEQVKPYV